MERSKFSLNTFINGTKYIYVGGGGVRQWKKRGFLSVPGLTGGEFGSDNDVDNWIAHIANTPNLWDRLDKLDGKTLLCSCRSNGLCHAERLASLACMKKEGVFPSGDFLFRRGIICRSCGGEGSGTPALGSRWSWPRGRGKQRPCFTLPLVSEVKPAVLQSSTIVDSRIVGDSDPQVLLHNDYPSCIAAGSGDRRVTRRTDGFDGVSGKRVCTLEPQSMGKHVLVLGSSQLRTFTTCRVSCPLDWHVVSIPGATFADCVMEIKDALEKDRLDVATLASIVLVIGTNDLSKEGPTAWSRDLQELLSLCLSRFQGSPILLVGPTPRLDGSAVPDIVRIMGQLCHDMDPTATRIRFADFGSSFRASRTELWAEDDPIHLSCNAGLPLLRDLILDASKERPLLTRYDGPYEWVWKSIEKHAKGCYYLSCGGNSVKDVKPPPRRLPSPSSFPIRRFSLGEKRITETDSEGFTGMAISSNPSNRGSYQRMTDHSAAYSHWAGVDVVPGEIRVLLPGGRHCLSYKRVSSGDSGSTNDSEKVKLGKCTRVRRPDSDKIYPVTPSCLTCRKLSGWPFLFHFSSKHVRKEAQLRPQGVSCISDRKELQDKSCFVSGTDSCLSPPSSSSVVCDDALANDKTLRGSSERVHEHSRNSYHAYSAERGLVGPSSSCSDEQPHLVPPWSAVSPLPVQSPRSMHEGNMFPPASDPHVVEPDVNQQKLMQSNDVETHPGPKNSIRCKSCQKFIGKNKVCTTCDSGQDMTLSVDVIMTSTSQVNTFPPNEFHPNESDLHCSDSDIDFKILQSSELTDDSIDTHHNDKKIKSETDGINSQCPNSSFFQSNSHPIKKQKVDQNTSFIKTNLDTDSSCLPTQILTKLELQEHVRVTENRVSVHEVTTDIEDSECDSGWYFYQTPRVRIKYFVDVSSVRTIQLNNLRDRGFTLPKLKRQCLSDDLLQRFIGESEDDILITTITTDDEEYVDENIESCTYFNSSNVCINYTINGVENKTIRLNNLKERGFNDSKEDKQLKFYSYLSLKNELYRYCKTSGRPYVDVFNDKSIFENALSKVNNYYTFNPDCAEKEVLEYFKGPQNFEERNDLQKLYYYGRGKIKYYRWEDLRILIEADYGQAIANKFYLHPDSDIIDEERFEYYLWQINHNISHNARRDKYTQLLTEYAGPQCYEDRVNPARLLYNVLYVEKNPKIPDVLLPNVVNTTRTDEKIEALKETLDSSFSLRKCGTCEKIRVLGKRAADKYPLGYYSYGNTRLRLSFTCEDLFQLHCDTETDIAPLSATNVEINKTYIAYAIHEEISFWGFLFVVKEINQHGNFKVEFKNYFGPRDYEFSDALTFPYRWLTNNGYQKFQFGSLTNSGRFTANLDQDFFVSSINVELREAKCCLPFHDTNLHHRNSQYIHIDPDNKNWILDFKSLVALRNIHSVLESIRILHCVKCNRSCPGFEDVNEILIRNNGDLEILSPTNDGDLLMAIRNSEVIKATEMTLSNKFKNTDVYESDDSINISSICTLCERYYEVDDNVVVPIPPVHDPFNSQSTCSQDSQEVMMEHDDERTLQSNQVNKWGPENLFTLNLLNNNDFESYMRTMTKAELMCISPLLLNIEILRSRGTQVPFSQHGSIAFPLKTPMEANTLPWYDFENLPLIIVYVHHINEKYRKEAKVNLSKIVRAIEWMEERIQYQGVNRSRNRLIDEGLCKFAPGNIAKLKEQLGGISDQPVVPVGMREITISEDVEKTSEPITKDLIKLWFQSHYLFAQAVIFAVRDELTNSDEPIDERSLFDVFWNRLNDFSLDFLKSKMSTLQKQVDHDDKEIKTYQDWIDAGTVVTAHTLAAYAENKKYLNNVEGIDKYDTSYAIFEEFIMLKQNFNNDLATGHVAMGGTVQHAEEHPDDVIERNLKDTALDRRPLEPDRENPAPEWKNSYLQRAFVYIFLTGDAALDQLRSVSLMVPKTTHRETYIKMLSMQKGVQEYPEFIFTLYNLLKRNDADTACACLLREIDVTSVRVPTKDDLNDALQTNKTAFLLMQKTPQIRDTPAYFKMIQQEAVGFKRDLEYMDDVSRPNVTPTYPSLFRTMAPPYINVYYLHKLFSNDSADLKDAGKRKRQALLNPGVVEWVISFLAELDVTYFRNIRYNSNWYLARNEHGANGNPHWHSVLYSQDLGKLIWSLKSNLENHLDELMQEKLSESSLPYTDNEIDSIQEKIKDRFIECQELVIDFFRGSYVNWNPALTHDGTPTDDTYGVPEIWDISLSTLIDEALMTSDLSKIDKLICDIIMSTCRHITHTGKNGQPSKRDYCYAEKKKKVKEECTKDKDVYKIRPVCKRRKPQPIRPKAAIYRDPHDRKFFQLAFACNDGSFNGADPLLILLVGGNADTKAIVPSPFIKCPKILPSDDRSTLELHFYQLDNEDPQEYILKYTTKSPVPLKPDNDIMKEVLQRKAHELIDSNDNFDGIDIDGNSNGAANNQVTFKANVVNAMYKQSAVQTSVCSFNAQHVIMGIPQILKNYDVTSFNCLGRKTIKKNTNQSGSRASNEVDLYNATAIQKFDERWNITDQTRNRFIHRQLELNLLTDRQSSLSLRTFYDMFIVTKDNSSGKYDVKLRYKVSNGKCKAIRFVPHTTMREANPNSVKFFPNFCKKMCLTSSKYNTISSEVKADLQALGIPSGNIEKDKEVQDKYWIDQFYERFPNFEGLEPTYKAYALHYHKPHLFDSDDDDDDDDDSLYTIKRSEPKDKTSSDSSDKDTTNAKKLKDRFYQDPAEKLFAHTDNDTCMNPTLDDDFTEIDQLSTNFYLLSTVEEDCRQWTGIDVNLDSDRLGNQIEGVYQTMFETRGMPKQAIPDNPNLTDKQNLVRDIILEYVDKKSKNIPVEPLRLFVIGIPGAGKTFAFKVAASQFLYTLGDKWQKHVRLACPTGSVAYHMGYGARTIHTTFFIEVGKIGESILDQVSKMEEMMEQNPKETFLIIFDECSMVGRAIFGAIIWRLIDAEIDIDQIGFIFFGDPAQCEPIGDDCLWSIVLPLLVKSKWEQMSYDGITYFRHIMGMTPLEKLPHYKEREKLIQKLRNKKKLNFKEISQKEIYDQLFARLAFDGNYKAVYLDQVQRTDGSPESEELVKLSTKVRYGKYELDDLVKLKTITATEKDRYSAEWTNPTLLTSFHFHSDENPGRTNADSSNAKSLVDYANNSGQPIMLFDALHLPAKDTSQLQKVPAKEFRNLANKLYLIPGAPIILTVNINASVSLYNGAKGTFIGPIYLQKMYSLTDFETFLNTATSDITFRTTKSVQIKLDSGSTSVLPVGTPLTEINGRNIDSTILLTLTKDSFQTATFLLPRRPPFQPNYLVVEIKGYSDSGGPSFFPNIDRMKDYVCITPKKFNRKASSGGGSSPSFRIQFPIELAYVMTAFKGIGATHERTEAKLSGMFEKPGLFLVACTRVKNPKHLFIPSDQWPTVDELNKQRLQESVLESENFERVVRAKSAQEMRKSKYYKTINGFPQIEKTIVNNVADLIHKLWIEKGHVAKKDKIVQEEIKSKVMENWQSIDSDIYDVIEAFMRTTDEVLLLKKVKLLNSTSKNSNSNQKNPKRPANENPSKPKRPCTEETINKSTNNFEPPINTSPATVVAENDFHARSSLIPFVRLQNWHNDCFINSSLQFLFSLNVHSLLTPHNSSNALVPVTVQNTRDIANQFIFLSTREPGQIIHATQFINAIIQATEVRERTQDDATVVLRCVMDNEYIFPNNPFELRIKSLVTCSTCNNTSSTADEPYNTLILPVPQFSDTLQNMINRFLMENDNLHGDNQYYCGHCTQLRDATKRRIISSSDPQWSLPDVLVIDLSRFIQEGRDDTFRSFKNTNDVDLQNHQISICHTQGNVTNHVTYRLNAAIVHIGDSPQFGHYKAFVKRDTKWYECNDANITECHPDNIKKDQVTVLAFARDTSTLPRQSVHRVIDNVINDVIPRGTNKNGLILSMEDIDTWLSFCGKRGLTAQNYDIMTEKVSLLMGDITNLALDCIVNAANCRLEVGGGVDGAIHKRAGGETLYRKTKAMYPSCSPGKAVIVDTQGTNLECKFVIHAVGPRNEDINKEAILRATYANSLQIVLEKSSIRTVAFPCISTGAFGLDNREAAEIALSVVSDWLHHNDTHVDRIVFCTFLQKDFDIYERQMHAYFLT